MSAARLLLDTHAFIWVAEGRRFPGYRLTPGAAQAIIDADKILVSQASLWEMAIKSALPGLALSNCPCLTAIGSTLSSDGAS